MRDGLISGYSETRVRFVRAHGAMSQLTQDKSGNINFPKVYMAVAFSAVKQTEVRVTSRV